MAVSDSYFSNVLVLSQVVHCMIIISVLLLTYVECYSYGSNHSYGKLHKKFMCILFILFFAVFRIKSRVLHMLGKCNTITELHPSPEIYVHLKSAELCEAESEEYF
jgi:hypothetical protein